MAEWGPWQGRKRGEIPIRTIPAPDRLTKGQSFGPRIELVLGRDGYSGGISMVAYYLSEDAVPVARELMNFRWQDAPRSVDECLQVAYRGLLSFIEESGLPLT